MRRNASRSGLGSWCGAWCLAAALAGCGSKSGSPPVVVPPPPQQAGAPQPVAAGVKTADAPKAKPRPKAATPQSTSPFPGEDPHNILTAASPATPLAVVADHAVLPGDQLKIAGGLPGSNSSQLLVAAAAPGTSAAAPATDFKLPEGFLALKEFGYTSDGLPRRIRCEKDDAVMALVPAGVCKVGVDGGPSEAGPEFVVDLSAFYMDVTEVTLEQFEKYRSDQREQKKRVPAPPPNAAQGKSFPVMGIPWGDAHTYNRWAGKELPTEAEFEKAGRGPDGFRFPWGNGRAVWSGVRTPQTITAVAQYAGDVSPYGIYDLAGNCREWVADWYSPTAHQEAVAATRQLLRNWTGPKKASSGSLRVVKGNGPDWSLWHRTGRDMSERVPDVGFRGVLRLPSGEGKDAGADKSSKKAAT